MDDLRTILASVGLQPISVAQETTIPSTARIEADDRATRAIRVPEPEPQPVQEENVETATLSDDDFSDILGDMGFEEGSENNDAEWSEADIDEAEEEAIDNGTPIENRDLDAEEDADWEGFHEVQHESQPDTHTTESTDDEGTYEEAVQALQEHMENNPNALPQNSDTFTTDTSTARFSGAEWYDAIRRSRIILAGVGGIGSWCALQIARMSPQTLVLYDDDKVEEVNMAGQLFSKNDFGKSKVDAISEKIAVYTSTNSVFAIPEKFTARSENGPIMMCGFDSMTARKIFFMKWLEGVHKADEGHKADCLFIDGRLSIDEFQVFCIRGDDEYNINLYAEKYLFSDAEAEQALCSMKQTTYLACMIGAVMVNLLTNFIANSLDPILPYDLPFLTQYDAQNMIFTTKN